MISQHFPQTSDFKTRLPSRDSKSCIRLPRRLSCNQFMVFVRCFELNQTCTCPQSNSILWLLMSSYVASGNQAIFQLLTYSPFSTHPARIFYSSVSESPQERWSPPPLARWFPENNPFCRTNELKSSVHYNQCNSEESRGSWCSVKGKECHRSLCAVFFYL